MQGGVSLSTYTTKRSAALLLVVMVVLGSYAFLRSSYFTVREVRVRGNVHYSDEDLIGHAGVNVGGNIFASDLRLGKKRLTRLPLVGQAQLRRHLPDTIDIEIEEIHPVAMVSSAEGFVGVARSGRIIGELPPDYKTLPILTGTSIAASSRGSGLLALAASILDKLEPKVLERISEVSLHQRSNVTLITSDLIRVQLGDESNMDKKLQVLNPLLVDIWRRGLQAHQVDLRVYDSPVIKYK